MIDGSRREDRHAWSEPTTETVAPGVHRVPLPLPSDALRAVNVYVLESRDDLTLVDGGWALEASQQQLSDGLARLGAGLGDIRRFLVTHMHRDHYTQAMALRGATGAEVALGAGEREGLAATREAIRDGSHLPDQLRGLRAAGAGELADALVAEMAGAERPPVEHFADPDRWLLDGERLAVAGRDLTAVETPGHTRGHLVFADDTDPAAGLLFAGDHVLPHITPSIGFEQATRPGPLRRFLASLTLLRGRPDRLLLPAHGPAGGSVHERVDELLAHHEQRLDAVVDTVERGHATAASSAAALTWTRREKKLDDLEPIHRMLAILETDAHLEVLAAQGRVQRVDADGVAHHHV